MIFLRPGDNEKPDIQVFIFVCNGSPSLFLLLSNDILFRSSGKPQLLGGGLILDCVNIRSL
jgi:hypothetical protein